MEVRGTITIQDNATATLRSIMSEQSNLRTDAERTRQSLSSTYNQTYSANVNTRNAVQNTENLTESVTSTTSRLRTLSNTIASPFIRARDTATATITSVTSRIRTLSNTIASPFIRARDTATATITSVTSKLKTLHKTIASPIVKVVDSTSSAISSISSKIKDLAKSVAIPVTIAATVASVALGDTISKGMVLEQQQVSIEHFISATNKDFSEDQVTDVANGYMDSLRTNANATPFETGDVIEAGARAIAIASGDVADAMDLVCLAEDMAAASGGTKTIMQAIEALADAKVGEMERLKEFGFKVSAEEFKEKGYKGVCDELADFYGGAAEKLATTGAGLLSTITGKLKSNISDTGLLIVEKLKPVFETIIEFVDATTPAMQAFGENLAEGIGRGIDVVMALLPTFTQGMNELKPVFETLKQAIEPVFESIVNTLQIVLPTIVPMFQTVFTTIVGIVQGLSPILTTVIETIGTVISTLAPIFQSVLDAISEKVSAVIPFISDAVVCLSDIVISSLPIISSMFSTAWGVISPILDMSVSGLQLLYSVVGSVFSGIQQTISSAWSVIQPLVESIGSVLGTVANGISNVVGTVTGKTTSVGKNAQGTNNWKGGLTWVGEEGPELIDLPKGSRVLPNKESISFANGKSQNTTILQQMTTQLQQSENHAFFTQENALQFESNLEASIPILEKIHDTLVTNKSLSMVEIMKENTREIINPSSQTTIPVPQTANNQNEYNNTETTIQQNQNQQESKLQQIHITLSKLADTITIKEETDIDKIGEILAHQIKQSFLNMA